MNLEMVPVEIVGLKRDIGAVLHILRNAGCMHIEELGEMPEVSARPLALDRETVRQQEELGLLGAQIGGLLEVLGRPHEQVPKAASEGCLAEARQGVEELMPRVKALTSEREQLESELASLPQYEATLRKLLPIIPASVNLPGNRSIGILVAREHIEILDMIGRRIFDLTDGRAEMVASDVDMSTRAMLIVFPEKFAGQIESLLGREDISRLRLPSELGDGPPNVILASLHRRMSLIPEQLEVIRQQLAEVSEEWRGRLAVWRASLQDELESTRVLSRFGETDQTFVLAGWVPSKRIESVQAALQAGAGNRVMFYRLKMTPELEKRAPVVLQNPTPTQPFESLVKMLALPRYGHIDPSQLMALFLPIFIGMILGDAGYGVIILALSLGLIRRFKTGLIRDLLIALAMGAGWSIIFGFLYGEAFGSLGEYIGMRPLWLDRTKPEDVVSLLILSLAVGAVHITLGLILGVREAIKDKSRNHLLERGGMLVGLIGLFIIVGVMTHYLPQGFMTFAIAVMIIGIVLLSASLGCLGIVMGPIEFITLIGNILSYLRIAAIGLASVMLAKVANEVAGIAGNIIVGVIIAALIHSLNLILGMFSPTIHSLRLHYVEFFRKFYEGGGRPYQPFKSQQ